MGLITSSHTPPAHGLLPSWPPLSTRQAGNGSLAMCWQERELSVTNSMPFSATILRSWYVSKSYYFQDICGIQRIQISFPCHQGFQMFSPKIFNNSSTLVDTGPVSLFTHIGLMRARNLPSHHALSRWMPPVWEAHPTTIATLCRGPQVLQVDTLYTISLGHQDKPIK